MADAFIWRTKKGRIHAIVVMGENYPNTKISLDLETGETKLYVPRKVGEDEKLLQEAIEAAERTLAWHERKARALTGAAE